MDRQDIRDALAAIGIAAIVFMMLTFAAGGIQALNGAANQRQLALDHHVARWTIDPVTGEREFVYGCEVCRKEQEK